MIIIGTSAAVGLPNLALAEEAVRAVVADAVPAQDGALPIYPGVKLPTNDFPGNFWSSGAYREMAFLQLVSQDDQSTVDVWYSKRLGTYTRKTYSLDGHHVTTFEGSGGLVKVETTAGTPFEKYGKTLIFLDTNK
jgi:hypothetical protein